jgi:hypothetical protein
MKLLRDILRLHIAGRSLPGRRAASRRTWTITVPAPLNAPAQPAVEHRHESAAPKGPGHFQLVSQA